MLRPMKFVLLSISLVFLSPKFSSFVAAQDIEQLRLLAEQGDEASQFKLGTMYDDGIDVQKDDHEAARWYQLAAEQGNASALFSLGSLYAFGDLSIRDYKESVKWYRLASEQGNDLADKLVLALGFDFGVRLPKDDQKAIEWYREAAEQGFAPAQVELGGLFQNSPT